MMLCSPGDDFGPTAFDFPIGELKRRWQLGLLIQIEWPLISQQGPADASLSVPLYVSPPTLIR